MNFDKQKITLQIEGGRNLTATKFFSKTTIGKTLIISSATGVLQGFYSSFASYFAEMGFIAYTFDYWGIGDSGGSLDQLKYNTTDLKEWGSIDQSAITAYAKNENPESEIIIIAHSIGGQITGFNTNYAMIDKLVLVASQNGYWGYFKGFGKLKMWLFWHLILPLPNRLYGYFPAKKFGLFENLPKNMVAEWNSWGKRKNYLMHNYNRDTHFFDRIKAPLLTFSFPKDPFAPIAAVAWLTEQFSNAHKKSVHYIPKPDEPKRIGHFGYFRETYKESLWKTTETWINNS